MNKYRLIKASSLFLVIALLYLSACSNSNQHTNTNGKYGQLVGTYVGDFGGSGEIKIVLDHVTEAKVEGYSLHKGLKRPLTGSVMEGPEGYSIELNEPGTSPYDGKITAKVDTKVHEMAGMWVPMDNDDLSGTEFVLRKQ